jgi:tetratricopeptide (TPR) repeat protein
MFAVTLLAKQTRVFFGIFVASQLAIGTVAVAQEPPNWDWCMGRNSPTFEQRISACTAIIEWDGVSPSDKAKAFGNRGVAYANNHNAEAAIRDYEESVRLDDTSGSSHRFRGNKYLVEKNVEGAFTEYNEAIRLDPTNAFALTNRGVIYTDRKDYSHAIADFGEALRLDPNWSLAYYARGRAYYAEKEFDRALADLDQAIQLNSRSADLFILRGSVHQAKGEVSQAITDYNQAIQLDPKSALARYNRGSAHSALKDYDNAIADLSEAITLNPKYASAYVNRGRAHYAKGNYSQAIADCDQAIRLDAKSAIAYNHRGIAHSALKDYDGAIADLSEAIRLNPKYASAYASRGQAYSAKGNYSQAIADHDQAIQIDPVLAVAYGYRCGVRIAAGQDLHAALSDCNESLRLQPGQTSVSTHRGFIHLKLGDINQAIADFDAALSIDPKYTWALYGRGLAKWEKGDTSGGQADASAARAQSNITLAVAKYYGLAPQRNLLLRLALASAKERPMVFAIAHGGGPDSCGAGCDDWIAADGFFDKDVEKRFRNFLDVLHGRKLPIFFNSNGGFLNVAFAIGRMLHERKMAAGVGVTVPEDCRGDNVTDESCRYMLQASDPVKARLRTAKARCASACVYAFIGASIRQIPQGAVLAIHAPLQTDSGAKSRRGAEAAEEQRRAERRKYTKQMGVDPELVELADKTPYIDVHVLTPDEIARLQIETTRH